MDATKYHGAQSEQARTADLMKLMPKGRQSVLEIGARDGFFSRLLTEHFPEVTALDLELPVFDIPGVLPAQGDVTRLDFPDDRFDCVVCTEVLEHVPEVRRAADEISRVARHEVIIGVPYRQDTRVGRTTCATCGRVNPPWGHVNRFDESRLKTLFSQLKPVETSFVWQNHEWTNPVSSWLMDLAGNPWGTYGQDESCIHCGARLTAPVSRSVPQKVLSKAAHRLCRLQSFWTAPRPNWIHMVFRKS